MTFMVGAWCVMSKDERRSVTRLRTIDSEVKNLQIEVQVKNIEIEVQVGNIEIEMQVETW